MKLSKFVSAVSFCTLVFALSACSGGEPEETSTSVPKSLQDSEASVEVDTSPFLKEELLEKPGRVFLAPKGTSVKRSPDGIVLTSTVVNPSPAGTTEGAYSRVSEAFERGAADHLVRVTIKAKAAEENPSSSFTAAYSTNKSGNSGWKAFEVSPTFKTYNLEYKLPKLTNQNDAELEGDFLGINADLTGNGGEIIVSSVVLEAFKP